MPSGYKLSDNTDLDAVFKPRGSATPRANTGFHVGTQDFADRYYPSSYPTPDDRIASNTGYRLSDGTDLRNVFRDITFAAGPSVTDPDDTTINEGEELAFTVSATGIGTLTYQWQKDVSGTWTNLSGETAATLSINPASRTDQGSYRCAVTDDNGTTNSNPATGTVNYPPAIASGATPTQTTYNSGDAVGISVTATAGQPSTISYQWALSTDHGANWLEIDGSTHGGKFSGYHAATLTFSAASSENGAKFHCTVSNSAGSDTSAATVELDIRFAPVILLDATDLTLNEGASSSFLVIAWGNQSPTYQWQKLISSTWTNLSLQTSNTLPRNSVTLSNAGLYRCVISNDRGTVTSAEVTLTVHENPGIVSSPSNITEYAGTGPYALQVTADGDGTLYFEWFKDGVSQNSPRTGNISATQDQHVFNPILESHEGTWHCHVTNSYGGTPADTANASVTVNHHAISITDDPDAITGDDGTGPYALQCGATGGDGTLQFEWFQGSTSRAGPRAGNIDATHDQHVFNPLEFANDGTWHCRVTDPYGATPVSSSNATVTVT